MSLTAIELLHHIEEHFGKSISNYQHGDCFSDYIWHLPTDTYDIQEVDSYGGEDCGTEYWTVWKITKGDEVYFIRWDGRYDSWNGTDWDSDPVMVLPHERTIIEYY